MSAIDKIGSETAVKCLVQVGCKSIRNTADRSATIARRMRSNESVESLAICRHHVFHIVYVFQSALDFERRGTGSGQSFEVIDLAHIFQ